MEEKGNLVQSMTSQMQAYEHRYNELQRRVRELEMRLTEDSSAGKASETVRRLFSRRIGWYLELTMSPFTEGNPSISTTRLHSQMTYPWPGNGRCSPEPIQAQDA